MSSTKRFALVDCNNFYASCEQVFNPKLGEKPLLILSNNDGCVIARSQNAKAIGVKIGDPAYLYRARAGRGEVQLLSSNFALYADMSERVMQTLATFSPDMEIYSIDEAFFLLEDSPDLAEQASAMRRKVKQWTGIPVSIGIGPTKTVAKLANEIAKKSKQGVHVLIDPEEIRNQLETTPLEDIWGIGSSLAEQLNKKGVYTAAALASADEKQVREWVGASGCRTALELRGVSCIPLSEEEAMKKSIVCSRSFPHPVLALDALKEAIATFATRAAEKLRKQESLAGFLSVSLATSPFREPYYGRSCHIQIPNPTSYTPRLIQLAKEALARIFETGREYKKAGVLLGDFCDAEARQTDLFEPPVQDEKKEKAMRALDKINRKYDKAAVRFAAEGTDQEWKSRPSRVSPKFTTSWHDLPRVR